MIKFKITLTFFFAIILSFSSCSNISIETRDNFDVAELPDGSLAYLNHNSYLEYDEDFDPRSIKMYGEIFLSVKEGETPFTVRTELCEIKVLGTEFNVKSDSEETTVEVEEGSIEIKTDHDKNTVEQGERSTYKKDQNEIKMGRAEFKFKIWMNNLKIELKKLGKEIKHGSKQIGKDSKEAAKELNKEFKKLKKK